MSYNKKLKIDFDQCPRIIKKEMNFLLLQSQNPKVILEFKVRTQALKMPKMPDLIDCLLYN